MAEVRVAGIDSVNDVGRVCDLRERALVCDTDPTVFWHNQLLSPLDVGSAR